MAVQREWFEKDYYKALGVSRSATDKEITKAYRKLAKQFHPDANPGDRSAEDRFKDVSTAYDVLGDPAKRREYDEVRSTTRQTAGFGGGGATRGPNPYATGSYAGTDPDGANFRFEDLGDLFGGLFGRNGRQSRGTGPQRGDDLEAELHLSFLDAINGVTTSVNVTSDATCDICRGSGAEPGTTAATCATCGGRGVMDDNQGVFSFSRPCPTCHGAGRVVDNPCHGCRGTGVQRRNRAVSVRMPPGVQDGQRIRLKGRGGAGRNGGPNGDLYVEVHVGNHELFSRKGHDLTVEVPVTYPELALGAVIKVPTLGEPVTVKIPEGTTPGKTFRIKGRGVAKKDGGAGDLLVSVRLAMPKIKTEGQRVALEAMAEAFADQPVRST